MRIEWTSAASADLADILAHLPPDVARNTALRIARTEANLLIFPRAAIYHSDTDTFERYVPKTRVILVYHLIDDLIEIIATFHTSRDPKTR
jgi:plasmid stabilization system protein ParE